MAMQLLELETVSHRAKKNVKNRHQFVPGTRVRAMFSEDKEVRVMRAPCVGSAWA